MRAENRKQERIKAIKEKNENWLCREQEAKFEVGQNEDIQFLLNNSIHQNFS